MPRRKTGNPRGRPALSRLDPDYVALFDMMALAQMQNRFVPHALARQVKSNTSPKRLAAKLKRSLEEAFVAVKNIKGPLRLQNY